MCDGGQITPDEVLKNVFEMYKYVRHSGGFSFGILNSQHKNLVPAGETPLSAGFIAIYRDYVGIRENGSISLSLVPDKGDPERLKEIFGVECKFIHEHE